MSEPLHLDPRHPERIWPPRTIREWIDLCLEDSEQSWFWKGEAKTGYLAALEDLDHFLAWNYERFDNSDPGAGTNYPPRTAPPAVGPETSWGNYE
jgi:hypothetical protein